MEFKDQEELKKYIKKRALRKMKLLLNLSKLKKIDTSKETLEELWKASLDEVKKEVQEEIDNGTVILVNNKKEETFIEKCCKILKRQK
jgi:hypothetical protein